MELKKVAFVMTIMEAEFLQGILTAEGIPSITQRNGGNIMDTVVNSTTGPWDILVHAERYEEALQILETENN